MVILFKRQQRHHWSFPHSLSKILILQSFQISKWSLMLRLVKFVESNKLREFKKLVTPHN